MAAILAKPGISFAHGVSSTIEIIADTSTPFSSDVDVVSVQAATKGAADPTKLTSYWSGEVIAISPNLKTLSITITGRKNPKGHMLALKKKKKGRTTTSDSGTPTGDITIILTDPVPNNTVALTGVEHLGPNA
jgi:hypothetical protein